jgi:hypothetical protein
VREKPAGLLFILSLIFSSIFANSSFAAEIAKHICPRCEDVVPTSVRAKHLHGIANEPQDSKTCEAYCEFKTSPGVAIRVVCGAEELGQRTREPLRNPKKIPDLEINASVDRLESFKLTRPNLAVQFSDRDTPCTVYVLWDLPDPNAEAKAIALARDVAAALTPAVTVDKPTLEAIVWNEDESGEKAQASLSAWNKEREAVSALLRIAPGFPKMVDNKDHAGLPAGKKALVFGFCPNQEAKSIVEVLDTALPGVDWYRVDGKGVAPSCPATDKQRTITERRRKRVGKLELSALVLEPTYGTKDQNQPVTYIYTYLRDAAGRLVDFKTLDARAETINEEPHCSRKVKLQGNTLVVRTVCDQEYGQTCKITAKAIQTTRIDVADGKLKLTTSAEKTPGDKCEWPD